MMLRKKATRRKNKSSKVSKTVKKYVKAAIHSNIENKVYTSYGANTAIQSASTGGAPTSLYLCPQLGQGTSQGQRIGNVVKVVGGSVRGFVNILPYSSTTNPLSTPIYVRMFLCRYKKTNLTSGITFTDFFQLGGNSAGFQGNILDMVFKVNTDVWTIYQTKTIKVGAGYASSTGPVGSGGYFDNSSMSRPFSFNIGKHLTRTQKYDDSSSSLPTNNNLWLFFQAVNADGSSSAINAAEYSYNIEIKYEDA